MPLLNSVKQRASAQAAATIETHSGIVIKVYQDANGNHTHADVLMDGQTRHLAQVPNASGQKLNSGASVNVNYVKGNRHDRQITGAAGSAASGVAQQASAGDTASAAASTPAPNGQSDLSGIPFFVGAAVDTLTSSSVLLAGNNTTLRAGTDPNTGAAATFVDAGTTVSSSSTGETVTDGSNDSVSGATTLHFIGATVSAHTGNSAQADITITPPTPFDLTVKDSASGSVPNVSTIKLIGATVAASGTTAGEADVTITAGSSAPKRRWIVEFPMPASTGVDLANIVKVPSLPTGETATWIPKILTVYSASPGSGPVTVDIVAGALGNAAFSGTSLLNAPRTLQAGDYNDGDVTSFAANASVSGGNAIAANWSGLGGANAFACIEFQEQ